MSSLESLKTVVVAGCASGVGKTSIAESITGVLSKLLRTAAVKITVTHGERGCPHGGKGCNVCSSLGGDFQIVVSESIITQPGTDTDRLREAGGDPVVWVITRDVALESAWESALAHMSEADCVVVESNSLTEKIVPSLTLMVVDASVSRKIWKPSAKRLIGCADFVIVNDRGPKEKREDLLAEIMNLRDGTDGVIQVSHPHEVIDRPDLMQYLKEMCVAVETR